MIAPPAEVAVSSVYASILPLAANATCLPISVDAETTVVQKVSVLGTPTSKPVPQMPVKPPVSMVMFEQSSRKGSF